MNEAEQRQVRIRELEGELQTLSVRLDFLVEQFMQNVPGTAATWIRQEFTRGIKDNAEHIEELGIAGVKIIKGDMEHLINELPSTCANLLRDRSTWAHNEEEPLPRPSLQKDFFFDRVFRDLISSAGPILDRHNLLGNGGTHSYWQRVKTGWRYGMNPSIAPMTPEFSEEYMKGLEKLCELKARHTEEKRGLSEVRAQTLWDSV